MNKFAFIFIIAVSVLVNSSALAYDWSTNVGGGLPDDPYQIGTAEQLLSIGSNLILVSKCYVLTENIDLTSIPFNRAVISGDYDSSDWHFDGNPFTGVFDGDGHTITGLTINKAANLDSYFGLFGYIGEQGVVKNLTLNSVSIYMHWYGGGLAGYNWGTIENCFVTGTVEGGNFIGGLVGINKGNVYSCQTSVTVNGHMTVGGLIGQSGYDTPDGTILNCSSSGEVTSESGYVGGLVGDNYGDIIRSHSACNISWTGSAEYNPSFGGFVGENYGTIWACYATGKVTAGGTAGGFAGKNCSGATISNCYASGEVSAVNSISGGFAGSNKNYISMCYATGNVSGDNNVGGLVGVNGGQISTCYAAGYVESPGEYVGGLTGWNQYSGSISYSFWNITVNPPLADCGYDDDMDTYDADLADVFAETTGNMQAQGTFTVQGWDFVSESANGIEDAWRMCVDGVSYPKLNIEQPEGDFDCPDGVGSEDLSYFVYYWLDDTLLPNEGADLTGEGVVNLTDWAILSEHWLEEASP